MWECRTRTLVPSAHSPSPCHRLPHLRAGGEQHRRVVAQHGHARSRGGAHRRRGRGPHASPPTRCQPLHRLGGGAHLRGGERGARQGAVDLSAQVGQQRGRRRRLRGRLGRWRRRAAGTLLASALVGCRRRRPLLRSRGCCCCCDGGDGCCCDDGDGCCCDGGGDNGRRGGRAFRFLWGRHGSEFAGWRGLISDEIEGLALLRVLRRVQVRMRRPRPGRPRVVALQPGRERGRGAAMNERVSERRCQPASQPASQRPRARVTSLPRVAGRGACPHRKHRSREAAGMIVNTPPLLIAVASLVAAALVGMRSVTQWMM